MYILSKNEKSHNFDLVCLLHSRNIASSKYPFFKYICMNSLFIYFFGKRHNGVTEKKDFSKIYVGLILFCFKKIVFLKITF